MHGDPSNETKDVKHAGKRVPEPLGASIHTAQESVAAAAAMRLL